MTISGFIKVFDTDISVSSQDYLPLYPINNYRTDDKLPIEFLYPKSHQYYTACAESFLYSKFKIEKNPKKSAPAPSPDTPAKPATPATPAVDPNVIAPGQQFGQQMFSTVHIFINGTCVTYMPQFYAYRGAIEQILSTSATFQNSVLSQELFHRDTAVDLFTPINTGYMKRYNQSLNGKSVEIITRLGDFPFNNIRQLPPGCEIRIRIMRSSPAECLTGSAVDSEDGQFPYSIKYEDMILFMRRYTLDLSVVKYHQEMLHKSKSKRYQYPVTQQAVRSYVLPRGTSNFGEILFNGRVPSRIVVAMVASDAYNGILEKDRLAFQDFGLQQATLNLSGDTKLEQTVRIDPDNKNYLQAYHMLLDALVNDNNGTWIDRDSFTKGLFLLVYQLAPAIENGFTRPLNGQLKLEMVFGKELTAPVQLLILGKFASLIQLDEDMNVFVEHSVI